MKNSILKFVIPTVICSLLVAGVALAVVFNSRQLAPNPSNTNCLTTDGNNNVWSSSCGSGGGGGGSTTTIAGLTPSNGVFVMNGSTTSDTNFTITVSTTSPRTINILPGFTGTLAAGRLNSNVVQSVSTTSAGSSS